MKIETIVLNQERNVTLTAITQPVGGEYRGITARPAVLVIPGGGYQFCSDREAEPVALQYVKAGYQGFVLRYSVGKDAVWPNPLEDYEQAITLIREKAEEWHVYPDKIAVIGFSAGGHLAASAATLAKMRPNAAILGYAVLTGETAQECEKTAPDTVSAVDEKTPPCFLFASRTDSVVLVQNTVKFEEALIAHDVSFESHIYSYGPHGFSTNDSSVEDSRTPITPRAADWVEDSIGWLKEVFGDFGDGKLTDPKVKAHVSGDTEEYLSVDCTIGKIMANPEGAKILNAVMEKMKEAQSPEMQAQSQQMGGSALVMRMKLSEALAFGGAPKEAADALDAQLRKIRNV